MKVKFHKLDFVNDENFFLIGIHSNVEIFFLAYLLNKNLKTSFKKMRHNIVNNNNNQHPFSYNNYKIWWVIHQDSPIYLLPAVQFHHRHYSRHNAQSLALHIWSIFLDQH